MRKFIALLLGLLFVTASLYFFEKWCEKQVNNNKYFQGPVATFLTVQELKEKFPLGIFPSPPPPVPLHKQYWIPFNHSTVRHHEFHSIVDKRYHMSSYRHVLKSDTGEVLWDIPYLFDEFRRRITPANLSKKKAHKFIALFGDSNIMGNGLSQESTLSNFLSRSLPDTKVYNYSGSGVYPYQILARTENLDRTREIPEKVGVALYFYMSYHLSRNMGGIHEIGQPWNEDKRMVDIDQNGEFRVLGFFREERPLWYWLTPYLKESFIMRYFNWDLKAGERDFRIQTSLIKKMRQNLESLGIKTFYVVIHPMQQRLKETQTLLSYLQKENIPFIYFAHWRMENIVEGPIHLVFDGHYSANANKVLSDGLLNVLKNDVVW